MRLYLHGRWTFAANKMSWLYHVASSPYNDTEEMEWVWDQTYVDWTNGKFTIQALSLSIKLRTSSKYDDCCLLYLPNVDTRFLKKKTIIKSRGKKWTPRSQDPNESHWIPRSDFFPLRDPLFPPRIKLNLFCF